MNTTSHIFARQPIVSASGTPFAFEFFYRNNLGESVFANPRAATASILVALLNQIGLDSGAGNRLLFINIDVSVLLTDLLLGTPAGRFVFELSAETPMGSKEREILKKLHALGYRFALDNVKPAPDLASRYDAILPYIDFVKFDTTACDMDLMPEAVQRLKGKKLIAQRVEIKEVFDAYKALGFHYFQGYYFEAPALVQHNRVDPKHLGVVKIYNMLLDGTPIEQVAREFKFHNELTLQLLQYLNSTSMKNAFPNRSVEEIVVKMGGEQLKNWLALIIFAKSAQTIDKKKSPLSKLMEQRIDVMHYVITALQSEDELLFEKARLMAFLSLMGPVFGIPLASVLKNVPVEQSIEDALLIHSGRLGKIFALTLALEKEDGASTRLLMEELGLEPELLPSLKNMIKM